MKATRFLKAAVILIVFCAMYGCIEDLFEEHGSVYGLVTDYSTNEPVSNAIVELLPGVDATLTGDDGTYEFPEVPVGTYSIKVSKEGYADFIDGYEIKVNSGSRIKRDASIRKHSVSLQIRDTENNEISELDFGSDEDVTKKVFLLFNGGTQSINYSIEKSADWITYISHAHESIDVGESKPIMVSIDRGSLAPGEYSTTLLITTPAGEDKELTVTMEVRQADEAPTVCIWEIIEIDSITYRVNCQVMWDGGQEVTERGICWSTSDIPTIDDETLTYATGGEGQYHIVMEHLTTNALYFVRAYAKNRIGISYSDTYYFQTNTLNVNGQSLLSYDFNQCPSGAKIAQTLGNPWTTWDFTSGGDTDGIFRPIAGSMACRFTRGNDQVVKLGDYETGAYDLEFDIYVPYGKNGFFNVLHSFDGNNSTWALQCYLHATNDGNNTTAAAGHGTVHAGSKGSCDLPCVYDAWMHFRIHIDADRDFAQLYFNVVGLSEQLMHQWQWSLDSFGNATIGKHISALDLFPPMDSNSEFYLDNLSFKKIR